MAAQILASNGEAGLSIESLMAASNMARGTFYNYWQSREELMNNLWEYVAHEPFTAIQEMHAAVEDPAERLSITARLTIRRAAGDPAWGWLIIYLAGSEQISMHELVSYPGPDLNAGRIAERFNFPSLSVARDLVVGATLSGIRAVLRRNCPPDYAELVVSMILQALGISKNKADEISNRPLPQVKSTRPSIRRK